MSKSLVKMLVLCSVLHLLVDGLCVCCLYVMASSLSASHLVGIFLTYNVLAFLTQPLTGLLADSMERRHWMLLASVLLLTMGVLATSAVINFGLPDAGVMTVAVLLGMGNSLFHVWGGKQVAVTTGNDMRALGAFVSTGAFGLALGIVFFSWPVLYAALLAICVLSTAYVHLDAKAAETRSSTLPSLHERSSILHSSLFTLHFIALLMLVVMLRSLVGETFTGGLSKTSGLVLLLGLLSMLGKMAGGWMARRMGIVPMLVLVVLLAAVCFVFRGQGLVIILVGLFAVNCTMPVTLYLANVLLPKREGLAFGLLAAALIPGYLLAVL
jgi:predicted MFS family arabinose efflux permease